MEIKRETFELKQKPDFTEFIMSAQQYAELGDHKRPYIVDIRSGDKEIYYFGFAHSCDPANPDFNDVKTDMLKQNPDLVIVEGMGGLNSWSLEKLQEFVSKYSEQETIEQFGENMFVAKIAAEKNIKVVSPEPRDQDQIEYVLKKGSSKEAIFVEMMATLISQYNRLETKIELEEYLHPFIERIKTDWDWQDFDFSLDNYKKLHKDFTDQDFHISDQQLFRELGDPIPWAGKTYTEVNKASTLRNEYRDQFMVRNVEDYLKKYKKIFIVFGSSHAVMQEPALRKMMEYEGKE